MNILIALIPALGWGIFPLIAGKIKNSHPANELMGVRNWGINNRYYYSYHSSNQFQHYNFFVITNFRNVLGTWTIWSIHFNEKYRYQ